MTDIITITGLVATIPKHVVAGEGRLPITSFRLASTQRRFDRSKQQWVDGETNWYTITAFRQLAVNAASSLAKGERVVVSGRLKIRDWESGERSGTTVEVEADALGHDLSWGTSSYTRSISGTALAPDAVSAAGEAAAPSTDDAAPAEHSPAGGSAPALELVDAAGAVAPF